VKDEEGTGGGGASRPSRADLGEGDGVRAPPVRTVLEPKPRRAQASQRTMSTYNHVLVNLYTNPAG
jgi:hypothetical protein